MKLQQKTRLNEAEENIYAEKKIQKRVAAAKEKNNLRRAGYKVRVTHSLLFNQPSFVFHQLTNHHTSVESL
jgi:hypothetical protein